MDKAFLLRTRERIVSSIKIGHNGALESRKQWLQKLRFAIRSQPENHPSIVGKNPNVLVCPQDVYPCLIKMHHRSIQQFCATTDPLCVDNVQQNFSTKPTAVCWGQLF